MDTKTTRKISTFRENFYYKQQGIIVIENAVACVSTSQLSGSSVMLGRITIKLNLITLTWLILTDELRLLPMHYSCSVKHLRVGKISERDDIIVLQLRTLSSALKRNSTGVETLHNNLHYFNSFQTLTCIIGVLYIRQFKRHNDLISIQKLPKTNLFNYYPA